MGRIVIGIASVSNKSQKMRKVDYTFGPERNCSIDSLFNITAYIQKYIVT